MPAFAMSRVACAALGALSVALVLGGVSRGGRSPEPQRRMTLEPNVPYDGRFTFVRLRYQVYRRSGWEFDYPTMERNLMTMVGEITGAGQPDVGRR